MLRVSLLLTVCLVAVAVANDPLTPAQVANLQNIFGGLDGGQGVPCKNYCHKQNRRGYECCDHIKPGQCPPLRPSCPGFRTNGPVYCERDDYCSGDDKCCPDACFDSHLKVCKPPVY
uniref:Crustin n=1 Tax=Paralithodes camtschaticus TaxID=6741 RepID=B6SFP4_PARCM|nr:crustin [Paralithodes camtschaticus]